MKKENAKQSLAKKKKNIKLACYVSLFFLVILLFMPLICRTFFKEKEVIKDKIIILLSCDKTGESISSSFLNGEPQNITYKIKGDHTVVVNPDEEVTTGASQGVIEDNNDNLVDEPPATTTNDDTTVDVGDDSLFGIFKNISTLSYSEEDDYTSLKTDSQNMKKYKDYSGSLSTIEQQMNFYETFGFACTKAEY